MQSVRCVGRQADIWGRDPQTRLPVKYEAYSGVAFVFYSILSWDEHMPPPPAGKQPTILWQMQRFAFCFDQGVRVLYRALCFVGNSCLSTGVDRFWGHLVLFFCPFTILIVLQLDLFLKAHKSCDRCAHSKAATHSVFRLKLSPQLSSPPSTTRGSSQSLLHKAVAVFQRFAPFIPLRPSSTNGCES